MCLNFTKKQNKKNSVVAAVKVIFHWPTTSSTSQRRPVNPCDNNHHGLSGLSYNPTLVNFHPSHHRPKCGCIGRRKTSAPNMFIEFEGSTVLCTGKPNHDQSRLGSSLLDGESFPAFCLQTFLAKRILSLWHGSTMCRARNTGNTKPSLHPVRYSSTRSE